MAYHPGYLVVFMNIFNDTSNRRLRIFDIQINALLTPAVIHFFFYLRFEQSRSLNVGVWLPLDVCHRSDQSCQVDTEDLQEAVAAACITEVLAEIKVENSVPPNRPAAMLYLISAECISLPLNNFILFFYYFLLFYIFIYIYFSIFIFIYILFIFILFCLLFYYFF